jgi:peptidoglycan/LPS O-acetylase OafA/YrhL
MKIPEIKALTGIRGLAALCVFYSHMLETLALRGVSFETPAFLKTMLLNGGKWVDVFFVLSGFVLAMVYRDWFTTQVTSSAYATFLRRRVARIYPLHFVMLLASLLMVTAAKEFGIAARGGLDNFQYSQLPYTFALIHAWGFMPDSGDWNPPSWSISIESLAYLLLPFVLLATIRRFAGRPWLPFAAAVLAGALLNLWLPWKNFALGGIVRGVSEFVLGCMAYNLYHANQVAWFKSHTGSLLMLACMFLVFGLFEPTGFHIALVTVPVLWALTGNNLASKLFAWRPMFFLGEISYSVYLGHFVFSTVAYRIINVQWMQTGMLPAVLGLAMITAFVLGVSTCTYYLIERRSRLLLDGRRSKPRVISPVFREAQE